MSDAYREAGVDVEAGRRAVERMKDHVARTMRPEVIGGLGGFGSLFRFDSDRFDEPILVSGTDGVGTKLKIAFRTGRHDTIGVDCVAMVVNDIAAQGAEPLFFLDYFSTGKLDPGVAESVVSGIADGCVQAGCALVGGETAEMPDMYSEGEYDLAGFAVGVVDKGQMLDSTKAEAGDVILGLGSHGIHSNGFSLVRKLLFADRGWTVDDRLEDLEGWQGEVESPRPEGFENPETLGELLLTPTRIYVAAMAALREAQIDLRGVAHITGGGFDENLPRMLSDGLQARIERGSWPVSTVFKWLAQLGDLTEEDLIKTFNCGIGFALVVRDEDKQKAIDALIDAGESVFEIGAVVADDEPFALVGEGSLVR